MAHHIGGVTQAIDSPFEHDLSTPPPARQRMTPDFHHGPNPIDYGAPRPGGPGINVGPGYTAPHNAYRSPAATFEVCRKKNDALKKSGGNIGEYAMWRDRILDHLCRTNRHWRHILETLQICAEPITRSWLMTQSHAGFSGWEIAEILEAFLVEWLSDGLYRRRTQLCGGEKGNGLEMWRWLYHEYQGGSEAVMLGGARRLQEWPRCNKLDSLSAHLDDWVECLQTYCSELLHAPGTLRSMLLGVIPTEYEDELLSRPNIKTWQEIIQWCKTRTVYKRQKLLAEQARKPGGRINQLSHLEVEHDGVQDSEGEPAATASADDEPPAWFHEFVNKLQNRPGGRATGKGTGKGGDNKGKEGKSTRFTFKGCWHCGDLKHSRNKCPAFQKLLADHNRGEPDRAKWKLPTGYAGKFEEAKKKARDASTCLTAP